MSKPIADFTLKTTGEEIQNLIGAIEVLIDEGTFHISETNLTLREMDPSRVAMVCVDMPKERFEEFEVRKPGTICLSVKELKRILGRAEKIDKVQLQPDMKTGRLEIQIGMMKKEKDKLIEKGHKSFTMPTLEVTEEKSPVPKVDFTTKWKGESEILVDAFEDTALASDHVKVIAMPDGLRLEAIGDFIRADVRLRKGDDATLDFFTKAEEEVISVFSLSYLTEIVKVGAKISDIATFEWAKDMPSKITYGNVCYFLAPRIEVD